MFFLDRQAFPVETGSLALLRSLKQTYMLYTTIKVRSYSRSTRLQCDISNTLV
jgi:hypothetical protein